MFTGINVFGPTQTHFSPSVDLLQVDLHEKNKREKNASREHEGGRLVKLAG